MSKLSLSMFVIALILFFFPWLDITCAGPQGTQKLASQSGFQIIYGGASTSSDMQQLEAMGNDGSAEKKEGGPGWSLLTAIAFLAVLGGVIIGVADILAGKSASLNPKIANVASSISGAHVKLGTLALIALILILINMIFGFPVAHSVRDQRKQQQAATQDMQGMEGMQGMPQFDAGLDINYRWPLYVEIIALAVPVFLMFNGKYQWVKTGQPVAHAAPVTPVQPPPATETHPPNQTG